MKLWDGRKIHGLRPCAGLELYHVAFVIAVFARRVVGWRQSRSMRTDFVLDALEPNPVCPPV